MIGIPSATFLKYHSLGCWANVTVIAWYIITTRWVMRMGEECERWSLLLEFLYPDYMQHKAHRLLSAPLCISASNAFNTVPFWSAITSLKLIYNNSKVSIHQTSGLIKWLWVNKLSCIDVHIQYCDEWDYLIFAPHGDDKNIAILQSHPLFLTQLQVYELTLAGW